MPRKRTHPPLRVLLNNRLVGHFLKQAGGNLEFRYAESWLNGIHRVPISLSLPLREDAYRGAPVAAVFENLLPDSEALRRRVAERVGAEGTDAYSLLAQIGRDCVGALQFTTGDDGLSSTSIMDGEPVSDEDIGKILANLKQSPLGLHREEDFRISVAGAQEKTALLHHGGRWWKPRGTTPTTHLFKVQLGTLPNGIDLSNSVENEWYCLHMMAAFGLPAASAEIRTFGSVKALVVERFDRKWTDDGRLMRLPQEDCCQALSVPPGRKYQSEGGPGMADILRLLGSADTPAVDQKQFLKAQMLFWLMGATDGHAKNFSLFLGPGGTFRMAPLYDVLTAQPSLDARQIAQKQMRLAMSAGDSRHYTMEYIKGRHFVQTAERARIPAGLAHAALEEIARDAEAAFTQVGGSLASRTLEEIHRSVQRGFRMRFANL